MNMTDAEHKAALEAAKYEVRRFTDQDGDELPDLDWSDRIRIARALLDLSAELERLRSVAKEWEKEALALIDANIAALASKGKEGKR